MDVSSWFTVGSSDFQVSKSGEDCRWDATNFQANTLFKGLSHEAKRCQGWQVICKMTNEIANHCEILGY